MATSVGTQHQKASWPQTSTGECEIINPERSRTQSLEKLSNVVDRRVS